MIRIFEMLVDDWRPTVEILVLAIVIYYILTFVRGTRAWPIVVGIAALVLLTFLANLLELDVVHYLLRGLFAFGGVAIVILFQPEIRRLLGQLGRRRFFNTVQQERDYIEVIVETAERLADVRIGALIAIQQATNLEDAVGSGVTVDSVATPEMLETIFFPNNAIHDGGVVVNNGRIIKAACIFPLTQRQDLQKTMGTRHRAALGLSEETDAVVVVVSEETGTISYAYKGDLKRGVSVVELRSFLTDVIIVDRDKAGLLNVFRSRPIQKPSSPTPDPDPSTAEKTTTVS